MWRDNARALVVTGDMVQAERLRALLASILGAAATVCVVEASDADGAAADNGPWSLALVDARGAGLDAVHALDVHHAIPVVAFAPEDGDDVWRAAAEAGAVAVVATDALGEHRLGAALGFAHETGLVRRITRLIGEAAPALVASPSAEATTDVLRQLCSELGVNGAELVLRPEGGDDVPAVAHTVGDVQDGIAPVRIERTTGRYTVTLDLHLHSDRHLRQVRPALVGFCGLVAAAAEIDRVQRTTGGTAAGPYRSLAESAPDPVLSLSPEGLVLLANPSFLAAAGTTDVVGRTLAELSTTAEIAGLALEAFEAARRSGDEQTIEDQLVRRADGTVAYYASQAVVQVEDDAATIHVILSDTTARVEHQRRLEELALTDPLTGLANRRLGLDRLDHALRRRSRHSGLVVVVLVDVDHLKNINDVLGHQAGDDCIRIVSTRLQHTVRDADTVARLGGDEFLAILEISDPDADVAAILDRLHREIRGSATVAGREIELDASIGFVVASDDGVDTDELIARADRALYEVKRTGRGAVAGYDGISSLFGSSAELLRQLRRAVDEDQFALRYQPIVDADGRISSAEGLLRWHHPEIGLREPADFIDALLDGPLAVPMGRWAVTTALEQLARWRCQGIVDDDFTVHVNISPQQLPDVGLVDHILCELDRLGLRANGLAVEVTEQALFELERSTSSLRRLRDAGVVLLLDDFGTGASSLSHLRSSVLDGIKIDRSFVADIEHGGRDTAIVEGLLGLGETARLTVIAEGIERPSQRAWFAPHPEARLQGFLFGRPQPAAQLEAQLIG